MVLRFEDRGRVRLGCVERIAMDRWYVRKSGLQELSRGERVNAHQLLRGLFYSIERNFSQVSLPSKRRLSTLLSSKRLSGPLSHVSNTASVANTNSIRCLGTSHVSGSSDQLDKVSLCS